MKIFLISALCILLSALPLHAQGMLPPKKAEPAQPNAPTYLLMGETLPKTLTAVDADGKIRPILSYKSANDVLVIGFYSPRCPQNEKVWFKLRLLYEHYRGWHAAFVGVSTAGDETLEELAEAMKKAHLNYPAVRDDQQKMARALNVTVLPEIIIVDDWGQLRYRGSLKGAEDALVKIIGHADEAYQAEPGGLEGCPLP
jgi:peroxiredoxin